MDTRPLRNESGGRWKIPFFPRVARCISRVVSLGPSGRQTLRDPGTISPDDSFLLCIEPWMKPRPIGSLNPLHCDGTGPDRDRSMKAISTMTPTVGARRCASSSLRQGSTSDSLRRWISPSESWASAPVSISPSRRSDFSVVPAVDCTISLSSTRPRHPKTWRGPQEFPDCPYTASCPASFRRAFPAGTAAGWREGASRFRSISVMWLPGWLTLRPGPAAVSMPGSWTASLRPAVPPSGHRIRALPSRDSPVRARP